MTVGSQVKNCYASLKSIEATIDLLATKSQKEETKEAFLQTEQIVSEVKEDLKKQVTFLALEEPQYK